MVSERTLLPLAMTVSSGSSGVSAPFSVLPEKWAEHTGVFGQAMIQLMATPAGNQREAAEVLPHRFEELAQFFEQVYYRANSPVQSVNAAIIEAMRTNIEQTLQFLQDLSKVKGPSDAIGLQFGFAQSQARLFAGQAQAIQREFIKIFMIPGANSSRQ
jgi:hypothetical protein